jgi:hypothetical protein
MKNPFDTARPGSAGCSCRRRKPSIINSRATNQSSPVPAEAPWVRPGAPANTRATQATQANQAIYAHAPDQVLTKLSLHAGQASQPGGPDA